MNPASCEPRPVVTEVLSGANRRRIAVLLTSFNRREKTLACLGSLFDQRCGSADIEVYLVDDASTDGTAQAVAERYPEVNVIRGTGDLFWSRAMALAQQVSSPSRPDFMLWLNDDVRLYGDAITTLLAIEDDLVGRGHPPSIVVGAMADPATGATTYSGMVRASRLRRMLFIPLEPGATAVRCDVMNGNLVLVPRSVYEHIGGFDPAYRHAMNDFDYGLRALEEGYEVWLV
jgi:GT2 family glycosyltransferase